MQPEVESSRLGIIGAGGIATAVIAAIETGAAGNWSLSGILARRGGSREGFRVPISADPTEFFSKQYDLILELAGPGALLSHCRRALEVADVWSVSGSALADKDLESAIRDVACRTGYRLRLFPGAIAGTDGVATASVDRNATVHIRVLDTSTVNNPTFEFVGSARDACLQFHGINVVAAAALAGVGFDKTTVEYSPLTPGHHRVFQVAATSEFGLFNTAAKPISASRENLRAVSASVIAALRQVDRPIWVG